MKKKDIQKIVLIQKKWKNILLFKNDLSNELNFFRQLISVIINNLETNKKDGITNNLHYKKSIDLIEYALNIINNYPKNLTVKFMSSITKFKIFSNLSKIKLTIIEICNLVGCLSVKDSIKLFLGKTELENVSKDYLCHIDYYQKYFTIVKIETYVSQNENNISFKLNTYGKEYKKTSALTLASYQIDIPSVNKYNAFVKNFKIKVSGAKIYIPLQNKLIVLYGYFNNDQLGDFKSIDIFKKKYNKTISLFKNLDINEEFKKNFVECLSNRDFFVHKESGIANLCI